MKNIAIRPARVRARARLRAWPALAAALAAVLVPLGGCAPFTPDGGFGAVEKLTRERTGQPARWARPGAAADAAQARQAELLAGTLTADRAVELALLANRGLQASFAELGIADADRVRAGRLRNPQFSFTHTGEIERALIFDVLGIVTLPLAQRLEQGRFEQAQLQAAADALAVALNTRRAWVDAVAAQQLVAYQRQVKDAADAASELAGRMAQAGNFNRLAQLREQAFQAEATAQLERARQQAAAARERLGRALGADDPAALKLPERLPELPAAAPDSDDTAGIEQAALARRLDVLMARRSTAAVADSLGLTKATRFVNVLNAGYVNKSAPGAPRQNGYEIELELPLFDFADGGRTTRLARAEAQYLQSLARTAEVAQHARSELRDSRAAWRSAHALARHYRDEVVPLRKRISDENLLRYNGMLISVFELLADAREQVHSVAGYVDALRAYWIAEAEWLNAAGLPLPAPAPAPAKETP